MKDTELCEHLLWRTNSNMDKYKVPFAIKLVDSIMTLLFKPGYTINFPDVSLLLENYNPNALN